MYLLCFRNTGEDDFLFLQLMQIMFFVIYSESARFPVKGQIINILGFASRTVSLCYSVCCWDVKAGVDTMWGKGRGCAPAKLHLLKHEGLDLAHRS